MVKMLWTASFPNFVMIESVAIELWNWGMGFTTDNAKAPRDQQQGPLNSIYISTFFVALSHSLGGRFDLRHIASADGIRSIFEESEGFRSSSSGDFADCCLPAAQVSGFRAR